jgi:hypothetical protein
LFNYIKVACFIVFIRHQIKYNRRS